VVRHRGRRSALRRWWMASGCGFVSRWLRDDSHEIVTAMAARSFRRPLIGLLLIASTACGRVGYELVVGDGSVGIDGTTAHDAAVDALAVPDSGAVDAPPPRDSGPDSAPIDATTVDAADCADQATQACDVGLGGCACTGACTCDLSCAGVLCDATCSDPGTDCTFDTGPLASTVDFTCAMGATCGGTMDGIGDITLTCESSARCDISCTATQCLMDCLTGAECILRCSSLSCDIDACDGARMSCPGRVVVCNAPCP